MSKMHFIFIFDNKPSLACLNYHSTRKDFFVVVKCLGVNPGLVWNYTRNTVYTISLFCSTDEMFYCLLVWVSVFANFNVFIFLVPFWDNIVPNAFRMCECMHVCISRKASWLVNYKQIETPSDNLSLYQINIARLRNVFFLLPSIF